MPRYNPDTFQGLMPRFGDEFDEFFDTDPNVGVGPFADVGFGLLTPYDNNTEDPPVAIKKKVDTPKPKPYRAEVIARPPVENPVYAGVLTYLEDRPPKKRDYMSPTDAGKCARQLSYKTAGVEPDQPQGGTSALVFALGNTIGDMVAEGIARDFPEALVIAENPIHFDGKGIEPNEPVIIETSAGDLPMVGFSDVDITHEIRDVVEVKSTGQYGFTMQTGRGYRGGTPEGPKPGHYGQGAIYAKQVEADRLVMLYVNRDPLSAKQCDNDIDRIAAEWHYTPDEFIPFADAELARLRGIFGLVKDGTAAARRIPGTPAEITDPSTGGWVKYGEPAEDEEDPPVLMFGNAYECGYCPHIDRCIADGPGRVPLPEMKEGV